jgi:integrase
MASRRMNGEGSVYQRSDGRWIGALTVGYSADGRQRRKTVSGRTANETRVKLEKLRREQDDGLPAPDGRMTVEQLLRRWLEDVQRHRVTPLVYQNYLAVAEQHWIPAIGNKKVLKLKTVDVDRVLSEKTDAGLSAWTVRRVRSVLVQALDQGVRWECNTRNVAAATRGPKLKRLEGRTLSQEQARVLLDSLKGHRFEALYVTALALGLRRGEVLGLKWSDLDLDAGTVTILRSLKRVGGKLVLDDVKTPTSRRALNLPAVVVTALRAHKARQSADRLMVGAAWHPTDLVFTTQIGTPIEPRNLNRDFDSVTKKAGIGHWGPHELRHSAASLMLAAGVSLKVVSEVLGHSTIRLTADTYGHVLQPQRQAAAETMSRVLEGSS